MNKFGKIFFSLSVLSSLAWGYSETIYSVQKQLTERGYNAGTPDGQLGRGTSKAIRQYQQDNGLRVNGRVTNELLNALGVSRNTNNQKVSTRSYRKNSSSNNESSSFFDNLGGGNLSESFKNGKYQVGFLAAYPSYGFSFKIDYSDKITLEAVLAPLGTFSIYSAKANYYLTKENRYNTYAYATGGVGMYEYTTYSSSAWNTESDTETVPMFGAGVGIEWSWRRFLGNDFPNLYSTIEVGYANMSFDYYNFGGFFTGGGIYYKF